ncbi:MAG: type IV pilin protein [Pseudomonadota bacterium]
MNRQQGFTLIELMVVVAILAVIAALAIPAYRDYVDTAQRGAIVERINGLRPFIENARIDTGTYAAGTYVSGGANDFGAIGYQVPGDDDGFTLVVAAGACGDLANCYKVTATNADGLVGVYENADGIVTWP